MAVKGKTNNPSGRPKGVPNKITSDLRAGVDAFIKSKWGEVNEIWGRLEDKDKLMFLDKMMKYVLPTLQAVAVDARVQAGDKLNELNDHQLNVLIDQILIEESDDSTGND